MSLHCTEISRRLPPAKPADWTEILTALSMTVLLCLSNVTFSQTDNEEPPIEQTTESTLSDNVVPATPEIIEPTETRDMNLLANEIHDQETVAWLTAADGKFLSLYEPEWNNNPYGAVLILHAEGQHADWPNTIEVIRSSLPQHGWSTLSTSLPNPDTVPIPKRAIENTETDNSESDNANQTGDKNTSENSEPTAEKGEENEIFDADKGALDDGTIDPEQEAETNKKPKIATETVAYSRIEAAISFLNDQGIYNIVLLGDGLGAARAGNFLKGLPQSNEPKDNTIKLIRAMVIINARNSSPKQDINLLTSLYDPQVATLDIYFGIHEKDNAESLERKKFARRNNFTTYQQILLPELSHNTTNGENRLTRRIRGFLNKHAKGVKVENAIVNKR